MPALIPAATVALVHEGRPASLLWARRSDDARDLPGFHVFPGGLHDARDELAPRDVAGDALAVTALRELFEEIGILLADGAEGLASDTVFELRTLFQDEPEAGHGAFAAAGLRWRTRALVPLGRWITPSFAPRRFDTHFFAVRVNQRIPCDRDVFELDHAEWIDASKALARWARGDVLMTPPVAALVRMLARDGVLREERFLAQHGARGEESQRWEVVPSLQMLPFRTPTLPPATHTNSFLVGSRRAVLIEPATPYPEEIARMVQWVDEARGTGIELDAIVATHHHVDHVGGAAALAHRLRVPLWAHAETARRLPSLHFARLLDDGDSIELDGPDPISLRAVHTPGHAPGHLCFVEETSNAMIAGDMVAGTGTILVDPHDGDMIEYLASLERMARASPALLLPAHGMVLRDPQRTLREYVRHRLLRETKIVAAFERVPSPASIGDLVPVAYDDAPLAVWPLAMASTEAHLIKLEKDGRARRDGARWVLA